MQREGIRGNTVIPQQRDERARGKAKDTSVERGRPVVQVSRQRQLRAPRLSGGRDAEDRQPPRRCLPRRASHTGQC
jgi:hypothetical protein